ncbi:hypothetical protein Tco_0420921 [Tanacetum coccineum]
MQVNVQFLQQLQPEWSRFMTVDKQTEKLKNVSYHKLFDILKQYQNEVNEIYAERIAKTANPLALVASAQTYPNNYYHAPKPQIAHAPAPKHVSTRHKGKEVAKSVTPPSESASDEDNTSLRYKNDNQSGQFGKQRTMIVAGAREIECRKPKWVKDYTYHKEKMLMFKQAEHGVPLQAEQADWLADTDEEVDEQELEAHYSFMAKIQEVLPADSDNTVEPLEDVQYHAEYNVFANERQHSEQPESINDTQVLEKDDSNVILDSSNMCNNDNQVDHNDTEYLDERLLKEKSKVISDLKVKEGKDIDKMISMEKQLKFLNEIVYKRNESIQTINMLAPKCSTYNGRPTFANPMYLKKAQAEKPCLYEIPYDNSNLGNRFAPDWEETITLEKESRSKLDKDLVKPYDYTNQNSLNEIFKPPSQDYLDQLAHTKEVRKKMWRKSFVKT